MRQFGRTGAPRLRHAWVCLVALIATGCGGGEGRQRPDPSTLTVLYPGEERILGPYWDMPAKFLMFLPLVAHDEEGELEGRLAKSWEHSPDYRTWTIHLRTDVRWHDGVPVTAHDVEFTLELLSHPDVLRSAPEAYSLTVLDDSTYTLTLREMSDPLDAWRVFYPKHLLEGLDPAEFASWDFWTQPVGNGPYRYVRHVPKTMMEFAANPDYYAGRPRIDRLILKFGGSSVPELLSGNVDVGGWVSPLEAFKLAQDSRFQVYWQEDADASRAILWKASHSLFRDPRVRRALTHAINRKELHQVLNLPEGLPIFDVLSTERQYRRGELPEPLPYDPDLARRLLSQAGWKDADGDGVLERDSGAFRFELIVPREAAEAGVYIQDRLRRVGIRVDLTTLDINLLRQRWRSGDFEAIIAFVSEGREPRFFGEESLLGYENVRVAELLSALQDIVDPDERDMIYRELMPIFQAEQPVTFLFPYVTWFVAHRRVRGLSSPFRADPLTNLEHLWIEGAGERTRGPPR